MSFLDRLFRRAPAETRAMPSITYGGSLGLSGGSYVDTRQAEQLSGVVACVGAISSALASLPARLYRVSAAGRTELATHPIARLIRQPNQHQSWPEWCEQVLSECLLTGNAVAAIERDAAGQAISMTVLPWSTLRVSVLPSGRLAYDQVQRAGGTRRFLQGEVFHLRDRTDDGLIGRSRISRSSEVLANAAGLSEYNSAIWRNAATPSGLITVPAVLSPQAGAALRASLDQQAAGAANGKKVMILDGSMTWQTTSCSPEDAQVLESRKYSVVEVCRVFHVPPSIIHDHSNSTFTNSAQASLWFATNTLAPWAAKIAAEFSRSVFTDDTLHLEVDLSGLVRGDYATRWAANVAAVSASILTADEVRSEEGWPPLAKAPEPSSNNAG